MDIEAAAAGRIQDRLFQDLPEGDHHHQIRRQFPQFFQKFLRIDRNDPVAGDPVGVCPLSKWGGGQDPFSAGGFIRLSGGPDKFDLAAGTNGTEHRRRKCPGTHEVHFDLVSVRIRLDTPKFGSYYTKTIL